ncbi:hypothetical protein [Cupriavidus necator]|nr:hypothetical protein [Cupriavidus necator]MDX6012845.1 hypothetical protein [Cupriavidus necator]
MNKAEKKILRDVIFYVAHHNKYLWWELKRQILDSGYQIFYPRQGEFDLVAEGALMRLRSHEKQALILEWQKSNVDHSEVTSEQIVLSYVPLIIEEVVKRATTAAYRTTNW